MKIKVFPSELLTFEGWADIHGLEMEVHAGKRYYVHFSHCEVKEGGMLVSASGYGDTQEEAINDYKSKITGQHIVINAYTETRQDIYVPHEWKD